MADFVVKSKVKEFFKYKGFQTSEDAVNALDARVKDMLEKSATRTRLSGMKTVKPRHV